MAIVGGIYRISRVAKLYGITFSQFLIDDERPTLIHTGWVAHASRVLISASSPR